MRFQRWLMVTTIALIAAFIGCAPKSTSPPAAPPPAKSTAASTPAPADAAWEKIVQAGKQEGKVVAYSYSMAGDVGNVVAKAFKDKYGITLEVVGGTSPVLIQRIRAEQLQSQFAADIGDLSSGRVVELKTGGLSASLKDLPTLQDHSQWFTHPFDLDPDGHVLMYYPNVIGVFANTGVAKPGDEPKSWQDLLDPKWKGKLIIADPGINQTASFLYQFFKGKSVYSDAQIKQLGGQFGKFIPGGQADSARAIAQGDGALNLGLGSGDVGTLIAQGAPLKAINLKEGTVGLPMGMVMLNKAPHPNATKVFINWFMSAEGLKVWAQAASAPTYRKDVPDFTQAAAKFDMGNVYTLGFKQLDETNTIFNNKIIPSLWQK